MNWLTNAWNWIWGKLKSLLADVADAIVERAKEIASDRDLVGLALDAVKAAAAEGLTGDKAWAAARDRFLEALKAAGRELGDCAVDTTLQLTYDAWKKSRK